VAASTEIKTSLGFNDVALCIYKVHGVSDATRDIGGHLNFHILALVSSLGVRLDVSHFLWVIGKC
jgi:hypothetical protein